MPHPGTQCKNRRPVHGFDPLALGSAVAQEERDGDRARQIISEAVGRIRAKVGDGKLVGQHNAEYGFARNLAGGAIIALIMAVIDAVLFGVSHNPIAAWFAAALAGIYILIIVCFKKMIVAFGHHYADKLIEEYMAQ
jgi:hypothetical protein